MAFTIAVHSLRGGTGKTLVSMNLGAQLVKMGYRVFILDMDLGAPSLQTYVKNRPEKTINDYLLNQSVSPDKFLVEATKLIGQDAQGRLFIGVANDQGEFISKMNEREKQKSLDDLYKLIGLVREVLPEEPYNADFIILDTSPGFSSDSLNCVAAADHLILMLRLVNADLGGTGQMLETLHMGLKPNTSLILNQVPSDFSEEDTEQYTKDLVRKKIINPLRTDKIKVAGLITNDIEVIDKEGEFAMYYLEGLEAQRPIHVVVNPNGRLAHHIANIANYVLSLRKGDIRA